MARNSIRSGRKLQHNSPFPESRRSRDRIRAIFRGKIRRKRQQLKKKNHPPIEIGSTVHLRAQSGKIITGQVVHMWEEKSVLMVRVASGDLVYNVPAKMLVDETKAK